MSRRVLSSLRQSAVQMLFLGLKMSLVERGSVSAIRADFPALAGTAAVGAEARDLIEPAATALKRGTAIEHAERQPQEGERKDQQRESKLKHG